jgi:methionine synthase II (cobalamin-independent)
MSSSPRLNPPFRADHIGSLKRPQALLQKRVDYDAKRCSREDLRVVEDEAINNIVNMQREAGIRSFTDGEFRR